LWGQNRQPFENALLMRKGPAYGDLKPSTASLWCWSGPFSEGFSQNGTSPEYAEANVHRENGVDDHLILASTETYSKFPPPKA
jgi:hypothetical protein